MGFIYGLTDPGTDDVRYIGQARDWLRRFRQHCTLANNRAVTARCNWLAKIIRSGLIPGVLIIEETEGMDAAEQRWIASYLAGGAKLLNANAGGKDLSHANKSRQASRWSGRHSPIQDVQIQMTQTIRFLERNGKKDAADTMAAKLLMVQERIRLVRLAKGQVGIEQMNDAMIARHPNRFNAPRSLEPVS